MSKSIRAVKLEGNPHYRVNLDLAQVVKDRLDSLLLSTGASSMAEVLRRALSIYERLERYRGHRLYLLPPGVNPPKGMPFIEVIL